MKTVIIFNRDGYVLESIGNGAAYGISHGDETAWIDYGDDATEFRENWDAHDAVEDPDVAVRGKIELLRCYL